MNKISPRAVVILVDMQDFFLKTFEKKVRNTLIENQLTVLEFCKKKKIPLVVLEYKTRGIYRGSTTAPLLEKIKATPHTLIIKEKNSGFTNTNLEQILKDWKIKNLFIIGINANACVQDTAISALKRGYKVFVSKETMACAWNKNGELSKRNTDWYIKKCHVSETATDMIDKIMIR